MSEVKGTITSIDTDDENNRQIATVLSHSRLDSGERALVGRFLLIPGTNAMPGLKVKAKTEDRAGNVLRDVAPHLVLGYKLP